MLEQNLRTVRGLSIALLILTIIGIVGSISTMGISLLGVGLSFDPSSALASLVSGATGTWILITLIFQLVAAVVGMGVVNDPQRVYKAFGWGIAGIVLSVLGGLNLINLILFIILVVKASAAKNLLQNNA